MDNCTCSKNLVGRSGSSLVDGAVVFVGDAGIAISNSFFVSNSATGVSGRCSGSSRMEWTFQSTLFYDNHGVSGGGICTKTITGGTAQLQVDNCEFDRNRASEGGAILADSAITIENCRIRHNVAGSGGGIFAMRELLIQNCVLESNVAQNASGGGVHCSDRAQINQSSFLSNVANGTGAGGSIFSDGSSLEVYHSSFAINRAGGSGGAIAFSRGTAIGATMHIEHTAFDSNEAGAFGGAVSMDGGVLFVASSNFTRNAVTGDGASGGAIYHRGVIGEPLNL
jgi:predicted outer membrane repeat protein